ncbi:uncharacterized protein TNCV_2583241 [Trichonephila clavipes]|nr:uncharacterized protein TNCV_2583241 [Trichonephila clavipes]
MVYPPIHRKGVSTTRKRRTTSVRTKEGKYAVSVPLKEEPSCLGNSKDIALKRLGSLWNRLARDENYLNLYREFLRDYERLDHMKEVTNETEPEITGRYIMEFIVQKSPQQNLQLSLIALR